MNRGVKREDSHGSGSYDGDVTFHDDADEASSIRSDDDFEYDDECFDDDIHDETTIPINDRNNNNNNNNNDNNDKRVQFLRQQSYERGAIETGKEVSMSTHSHRFATSKQHCKSKKQSRTTNSKHESVDEHTSNSHRLSVGGGSVENHSQATSNSNTSTKADWGDHKFVRRLREFIIFVLIGATLFMSLTIYYTIFFQQVRHFEEQYNDHAIKYLNAVQHSFINMEKTLVGMSVRMNSNNSNSNNITILQPWGPLGASTLALGRSQWIGMLPYIKDDDRLQYQQYATQHVSEWMEDATEAEIIGYIHDNDDFPTSVVPRPSASSPSSYYYPMHQHYPTTSTWLNYNLLSHPFHGPELLTAVKDTAAALQADSSSSPASVFVHLGSVIEDTLSKVDDTYAQQQTRDIRSKSDTPGFEQPTSTIYSVMSPSSNNNDVWMAKFRWIDLFQATHLSTKTKGMLVILEESHINGTSLSTTTFSVDSQLQVQWLGQGDLHANALSYLKVSKPIPQRQRSSSNRIYHIHTYPSQEMKDRFFNFEPLIFTAVVLVVFAFTSLIFLGYDYYVDQRQRVVMRTAKRNHAIVTSLFPKTIRDRLFKVVDVEVAKPKKSQQQQQQQTDSSMHGVAIMMTQRAKLRNIMNVNYSNDKAQSDDDDDEDASITSVEEAKTEPPKPTIFGGAARTLMHNLIGDKSSHGSTPNLTRRKFFGQQSTHSPRTGGHAYRTTNSNVSASSTSNPHKSSPIADLFTRTTVLFADIDGFTAWSSSREPTQVFILLETVYGAFDELADKRKVFKVETIGDSYVAVTGLPDPQPDHAIVMAKFAYEMQMQMTVVSRQLVVELGPDTADLSLRVGLHSGPVIAGVLRGQKSRFQLFGDTVNTAARMESTGKAQYIQCSQSTADALKDGGKVHWLLARGDLVMAKGKGALQTYWVDPRGYRRKSSKLTAPVLGDEHFDDSDHRIEESREDAPPSRLSNMVPQNAESRRSITEEDMMIQFDNSSREMLNASSHKYGRRDKASRSTDLDRQLDWNVDLLSRLLKGVVARQMDREGTQPRQKQSAKKHTHSEMDSEMPDFGLNLPRDEYEECIHLPQYRGQTTHERASFQAKAIDPEDVELDDIVEDELRDYVYKIACSYHSNPFHNYDHATHVTMSANKILNRVVAGEDLDLSTLNEKRRSIAAQLHDYTYGLTSDPLTHFACVFSAMIHDVDHPGVPNSQLIKEHDEMAQMYDNKSVAEQNSVDLSWNLLMDPAYQNLRAAMFANEEERKRFRQLLINSVMATDIFDPDLVAKRNQRWDKAFSVSSSDSVDSTSQESADLKATIVIEHIIQAADVSHTMQHWHVYQKWNRRLFNEMYGAYKSGRLENDPSKGWYKGELWFYDNYIIPLAMKLKDCGVFGVSSDEFLNYATMNRSEWEIKGQGIVDELISSFEEMSALTRAHGTIDD